MIYYKCLCSQGLGADYFAIDQLLSASSRCIYHLRSNLATHVAWESPSALHYHARKLFWIVYVCDKGFSLVTGLAPRLQDTLCDLGLAPVSEHLEQPDGSLHIDGNPYPGSYLFIYAHLAQIQSSIYHELYAPGVMQRSDADIIRNIRYLDHALEQWKDSIPVEIRPTFVPVSGLMRQVLDIRFSIFHLQYHHCMLLIHQSSSRCTSWEGNQNTQNNSSSLAISVSACRSLLRTFLIYRLELGPPNLLWVFFSVIDACRPLLKTWVANSLLLSRFCLSYFIQAVINLFCKVLSNPLGDGNQEDLHLMDEISQLIAESHGRDDPPGYLTKTKFAEEFILELKRLSQCAIDKAIRDKLA